MQWVSVKKFALLVLLFGCLRLSLVLSQEFPRGAVLDEDRYNSLPQKPVLTTRAYTALPPAVSLKPYAPLPGDQTVYGTCVAWASAYAARTISESVIIDRRDRGLTTENVFSPAYVYKSISDDPTCQSGTTIYDALDLMKAKGAAKMLSIERDLDFKKIILSLFAESRTYPIEDYVTLHRSDQERNGQAGKGPTHVQMVKKSLSEQKPVIIGMNTPNSFMSAETIWRPREDPDSYYGGHAMCVIGYDDAKYGGAFEVQNSWGKKWGNSGFIWIPYDTFNAWVIESYEIIENLGAYNDTHQYSGFAEIALFNPGQGPSTMPVEFTAEGYYRSVDSYPSGTEFRFLMGNSNPAYVYAFAADSSTTATTAIFPPPGSSVSPVLDYSENTILWPGEQQWIRLDETPGTDYLVILYAKQALDMGTIRRRFEQAQGTFPEKAAQAVGSGYILPKDGVYQGSEIRFNAQTENSKAVFPLLLAIEHR
jgi:hypothetical protein